MPIDLRMDHYLLTQPTYGVDAGIEPGPHWWEGSALTTVPSLAPQGEYAEQGYTGF